MERRGESLPAIAGIPMRGEKLGSDVFDGTREVAFFPVNCRRAGTGLFR